VPETFGPLSGHASPGRVCFGFCTFTGGGQAGQIALSPELTFLQFVGTEVEANASTA
jgi:hypothetical protein